MNDKRSHYEALITKMAKANQDEYYLEACWLAYAIMEDRLLSALRNSGGENYRNGKPIRGIGKKSQEINYRKKKDDLLKAYFSDHLMDRVYDWKESRNDLAHAMADGSKTMSEIYKAAYLLCEKSDRLVKDLGSAAMRLKKHRDKVTPRP